MHPPGDTIECEVNEIHPPRHGVVSLCPSSKPLRQAVRRRMQQPRCSSSAEKAMVKQSSGGISRPCFFVVAAILWVVILYLRLLVPIAFSERVVAPADTGGGKDLCRGRYVYIHDLPARFNADILRDCGAARAGWPKMCDDVSNGGVGRPLSGGALTGRTGWYATHQFALDVIFHGRMRQYRCLTNDSEAADAVFVPFYAGFEFAAHSWGFEAAARDAESTDLMRWLVQRNEWRKAGGRDHFLVGGRTAWDFMRSDPNSAWGNAFLLSPAAKNMTLLAVETATFGWGNDFAVPYPTYFHPRTDADVLNWQRRIRNSDRWWLMSFVGATRPDDEKSIRSQIVAQCTTSPSCRQLGCAFGSTQCHYPGDIMVLFMSSTFCLQPSGDSSTRRSTFDAMLAGCIPVFFKPRSAYLQYRWHLPRDHATYSVLIPEESVRAGNVSIEEELRKIPPVAVEKMREEVIKLVPRLVYADPRHNKLRTVSDAFDVSMNGVLERVKTQINGGGDYGATAGWR